MKTILALLIAVLLTSCSSIGKQDVSIQRNCQHKVEKLPSEEIKQAQLDAASGLQTEVSMGTVIMYADVDWNRLPEVKFVACDFWVDNPDSSTTNTPNTPEQPGTWAIGVTLDVDHIQVATFLGHDQTVALIKWETRNAFLIQGKRRDLAN